MTKTRKPQLLAATFLIGSTGGCQAAGPADQILRAKEGATVVLSGTYPTIIIANVQRQRPVTIDASKATIAGVIFDQSSGFIWRGGTITAGPHGYAVSLKKSSSITLIGSKITAAIRGVVINHSSDVQIIDNSFSGLRSDGIDIVGERVEVRGNVITGMDPIKGDHPDGIQLWSANGVQTRDIVIRNNRIVGRTQGIFGRTPGLGLSRITVTGNQIEVSYPNGIAFEDVSDGYFSGNTVRWHGPTLGKANMRARGSAVRICGNVVPDVPSAPANSGC